MGRQTPTGTTEVQIGDLGTATCFTYEGGTRQILGIPYGRLSKRWTRALLADSWENGRHDGTRLGPRSHGIATHEANIDNDLAVPVPDHPQIPRPKPSELGGCLNLNVSFPSAEALASISHDPNTTNRLPVIVYIHGGGWVFGSGGTANNDGAAMVTYALNERKPPIPMIYVTLNYRLGLGGFLASQAIKDDLARDGFQGVGNFALTDMQLALEWVQRYIPCLGGDPDNVTLAGQSAGAASVGHLMLARGAERHGRHHLGFQRAIMLSGNVDTLENWTLEMWEKRYRALCEYFGINPDEGDALEQLRRVDEVEIANATEAIEGPDSGVVMNVCVDGWFHSDEMISQDKLLNRPCLPSKMGSAETPGVGMAVLPPKWLKSLMIGCVRQEGLIFKRKMCDADRGYEYFHGVLCQFALSESEATEMLELYGITPDLEAGSEELGDRLSEICGDVFFKIPAWHMAHVAAKVGPGPSLAPPKVYGYQFDRPSSAENAMKGLAHHSVDNIYAHLNALDIMTPEQGKLAKKIADDWIDFAVGEKDPWDELINQENYAAGEPSEPKWMIYQPDDTWKVKTEAEDDQVRGYKRMEKLMGMGWYQDLYKAACVWRATKAPYLWA